MAPKVTEYTPIAANHCDPTQLEETRPLDAALLETIEYTHGPDAIRDKDGDGFREVDRAAFEATVKAMGRDTEIFPLACYFHERHQPSTITGGTQRSFSNIELPKLVHDAITTRDHDYMRRFFSELAKQPGTTIEDIGQYLEARLTATGRHPQMNVPDNITPWSKNGFSQTPGGQDRIDCWIFAQLAFSDLSGVAPQLDLQYYRISDGRVTAQGFQGFEQQPLGVTIYKKTPIPLSIPTAPLLGHQIDHVVLVATDADGHSIIVDNNTVTSIGNEDPSSHLRKKNSYSR
jgi:hypothetical protein